MPDNTGAYISYQDLLCQLFPSTFVSYKSNLTLSNKSANVFDIVGNTFSLEIGDIVTQGKFAQVITAIPSAGKIELEDAANFSNGNAMGFRSIKTLDELGMYRALAMQQIDLWTGQWFNKRTFDDTNPVKFEGSNTPLLHFPVPIILIDKMVLNGESEFPEEAYKIFNSRTLPDDRRNPKILLVGGGSTIFQGGRTTRFFYAGYLTTFEGSWGFLEEDGSTPAAIKWATGRWIAKQLAGDLDPLSGSQTIKREKTDLHEIEYTNAEVSASDQVQTNMSGDKEIDRILQMYKAPLTIGGTVPTVFKPYTSREQYNQYSVYY